MLEKPYSNYYKTNCVNRGMQLPANCWQRRRHQPHNLAPAQLMPIVLERCIDYDGYVQYARTAEAGGLPFRQKATAVVQEF